MSDHPEPEPESETPAPPALPADASPVTPGTVDPDETPFASPEIAGLPYRKGSEEDRAVEQVIREAEAERAAQGDSA